MVFQSVPFLVPHSGFQILLISRERGWVCSLPFSSHHYFRDSFAGLVLSAEWEQIIFQVLSSGRGSPHSSFHFSSSLCHLVAFATEQKHISNSHSFKLVQRTLSYQNRLRGKCFCLPQLDHRVTELTTLVSHGSPTFFSEAELKLATRYLKFQSQEQLLSAGLLSEGQWFFCQGPC